MPNIGATKYIKQLTTDRSWKVRMLSWALLFSCSVSAGERAGMTTPWGWVLLIRGWILNKQLYWQAPLSDPCQYPSPMTFRDCPLGKQGQAPCPSGCASTSCVMEHFLRLTPVHWELLDGGSFLVSHWAVIQKGLLLILGFTVFPSHVDTPSLLLWLPHLLP